MDCETVWESLSAEAEFEIPSRLLRFRFRLKLFFFYIREFASIGIKIKHTLDLFLHTGKLNYYNMYITSFISTIICMFVCYIIVSIIPVITADDRPPLSSVSWAPHQLRGRINQNASAAACKMIGNHGYTSLSWRVGVGLISKGLSFKNIFFSNRRFSPNIRRHNGKYEVIENVW